MSMVVHLYVPKPDQISNEQQNCQKKENYVENQPQASCCVVEPHRCGYG